MAGQFTPGPWKMREVGDLDIAYSIDAGRNAVADVYNHADEWEANAHLIAAAPELYRVLTNAVAQYDAIKGGPIIGALEAARSILAKARGDQ